MRFAMDDTNMETADDCRLFPYFNYKLKNAKKHAFCNGKPEYGYLNFKLQNAKKHAFYNGGHKYGNCLQL